MFMLLIDETTNLHTSSSLFGPSSWRRMTRHHSSPTQWITTASIGYHGDGDGFVECEEVGESCFGWIADVAILNTIARQLSPVAFVSSP